MFFQQNSLFNQIVQGKGSTIYKNYDTLMVKLGKDSSQALELVSAVEGCLPVEYG